MVEARLQALAPMLTRWTMGGSALTAAPAEWREALGNDANEAELRLLALAGQLLGTLTVAEPAGELSNVADLPALSKPPLGDALRPRARRLLIALRETGQRQQLLALLDRRGWTLHPGDWLPGASDDDVPAVYAPWQDWVANAGQAPSETVDEISAENWDDFGPAARRVAFAALRRRDPNLAAALLAAKIASEPPDRRLLFLDLLVPGLSAADQPALAALANDRAPRVKARATSLLARLGQADAAGGDAGELAGFFEVKTKGWMRKSLDIVPQALKTPAQRSRRAALMDVVSIAGMAEALGLAPDALVTAWPWGSDAQADHAIAAMAERTATDAVVTLAADALIAKGTINLSTLAPLLSRLPAAWRRQTALTILEASGGTFLQGVAIAGGDGGIDGAISTMAGRALLSALNRATDGKPTDHAGELVALGLLASRTAAAQALTHLAGAGLIASDPRLDMLRLNAALDDRGVNE